MKYHHVNYGKRDGIYKFHHRFSFYGKRRIINSVEVCSGRALKLELDRGDEANCGNSFMLSIGLLFFKVYVNFNVPASWILKRKCIATWDNGREFELIDGRRYGFYFYHWAFVWHWHAKQNESSSKDPWWMRQYIHLDDLILGKTYVVTDELMSTEDVWFRLGDKEFKINSIKWTRYTRFRSRIPFALWKSAHISVKIDINDPPMRSGKGENSWDCGDDGSYGLSTRWEGSQIHWKNMKELQEQATWLYVESVLKDSKRYGGSNSERGIRSSDTYTYIGKKNKPPTATGE